MSSAPIRWTPLLLALCCVASAQVISFPTSLNSASSTSVIQSGELEFNLFLIGSHNPHTTEVQSPDSSISRLDLKAPRKARREYDRGYRLLMQNDAQGALQYFTSSIAIYPKFVAAHNALGSAYLKLGENQQAYSEFSQAIALDGHLPNSYLNLACAELALKQFPAAEESLRKAASIAPLDVQLKVALAYGEFANHDYPAVIETARQVHAGKHEGAAVVHLFAAGAWDAQGDLKAAQQEMEILLQETSQPQMATQFNQILQQIKSEEAHRAAKLQPASLSVLVAQPPAGPTPEEVARLHQLAVQQQAIHQQLAVQEKAEESQIAEAEAAPAPSCADCTAIAPATPSPETDPVSNSNPPENSSARSTLHLNVDEISVMFTAIDRGKSVTDLTLPDIDLRDAGHPPVAILGFRNESQLPLRLGLVIDTSASVASRFSFEQDAAAEFLEKADFGNDDLAFAVGVNNLVLLAQDFTADPAAMSQSIRQLVPSGGTSLWDAVAFAADKMTNHPEAEPVARILVVISDGNDNSSTITLKQAIAAAQRGDVAVYTVSTGDALHEDDEARVGRHALQALSDLTGGAALVPDSLHDLKGSLADLQQVIRSRYLISYQPASFQRDGRYRTIDLEAQKDGRQLKVFARKGYYASPAPSDPKTH